MNFDQKYWDFVFAKMGGEAISISTYSIYDRVEITFDVDSVNCIFNPPKDNPPWRTNFLYSNDEIERIIKSYFFLGWYLKDISDDKYKLPVFMQKQRVDRNMLYVMHSLEKFSSDSGCKIKYLVFNRELEHWTQEYIIQ